MCLSKYRYHLPDPLWARIFSFVKSPKDLHNLIHALPYFAKILEPQLPHIQMQLAFPHLANLIQKREANKLETYAGIPVLSNNDLLNCRLVCKSWDKACKRYFEHGCSLLRIPFIDERNLTGNHFYRVGLTDTQLTRWRIRFRPEVEEPYNDVGKVKELDHIAEMARWAHPKTKAALQGMDDRMLLEVLMLKKQELEDFTRTVKEHMMMDDLRRSQGRDKPQKQANYRKWLQSALITHPSDGEANPLFSRRWICDLRLTGGAGQRYLDSLETLQAYGRHLKGFSLYSHRGLIPLRWLYASLTDWLNLTPNLRSLSVSCVEVEYEFGLPPPLAEAAALKNFIETYPLPELPLLKQLCISACSPKVQHALLERFHQVEELSLHLHPTILNWGLDEAFQPAPLENLRRLTLTIRFETHLLIVGRIHHPSWNQLESLKVDFSFEHYSPEPRFGQNTDVLLLDAWAPSWERIISWLNQYFSQAPTLTKVFLALPRYHGAEEETALRDTQRCRLQLRHVEELKLRLMNGSILMDFLLPMKDSLQKMAIEFMPEGAQAGDYPPNAKVDLQEDVQWNGFLGKKLLESNLWGTFPKLEFLRIESYKGWTYRRRKGTPVFINPDGTEEELSAEHGGELEAE